MVTQRVCTKGDGTVSLFASLNPKIVELSYQRASLESRLIDSYEVTLDEVRLPNKPQYT